MARILIIADHRPDRSPSQRFRFEQYLSIISAAGHTYEYSWLLNESDDQLLYQPGKYFQKFLLLIRCWKKRRTDLKTAAQFDLVFIQREAMIGASAYFEKKFSRSGAKVIFDFDDSIWKLDISPANRRFGFLKNPGKTADIIRYAHQIIAGNNYLADYAKQYNKNVIIIPTTIDTGKHVPVKHKNNDQTIVIGWTGSHTTIKHFELAVPFLKTIRERYKEQVSFVVIGDENYQNNELGIRGIKWQSSSEIEDLQQCDIGIMPLPDDEWAKGKCGLKGLQYMALEIPTIMSPVGVNTSIIRNGENGFLADKNEEWVAILCDLIEHPEKRAAIGRAGRETVEQHYSVTANAPKYLQLIENLVKKY